VKLLSQEDFTGKVFPQAPDNASDVYRDLVEHSHDLLCTHDLSGKLLSVNPTPARLLGYEVDELLHTPMRNLIAPEYCAQFDDYLVTIKREGVAKGYLALVTKSGERRIWEYHNTLRTEGLPSPVVRGIAHDVTDQKRAEKELRRATQQNRQIITGVGHGLILVDRNLRCVVWNRYMEELTLLPFEQVWGRDLLELLPQLQECGIRALLEQALTGKSLTIPDVGVRSARGDVRWLASKLSPLFGSTGENNGIIIALHDVTERRKAEDALRQSEARFRVALKSSRSQFSTRIVTSATPGCTVRGSERRDKHLSARLPPKCFLPKTPPVFLLSSVEFLKVVMARVSKWSLHSMAKSALST